MRLCPAYPGNPRSYIEGGPPQGRDIQSSPKASPSPLGGLHMNNSAGCSRSEQRTPKEQLVTPIRIMPSKGSARERCCPKSQRPSIERAAPQACEARHRGAAGAVAPPAMARPALEVADILRDHGPAWREANRAHVS